MKEKGKSTGKTAIKTITQLLSSLLIAAPAKLFGVEYTVLNSDIVSIPVESLLSNKNSREFPDQGQSIYTLTVNSTIARIAETQEISSGKTNSPNCQKAKMIGSSRALIACGSNLDSYTVKDGKLSNPTTLSPTGQNIQDFTAWGEAGVAYVSLGDTQEIKVGYNTGSQTGVASFDQSTLEKKLQSLSIVSNRKDSNKVIIYQKIGNGANSNLVYGDLSTKSFKSLDISSKFADTLSGIYNLQVSKSGELFIIYKPAGGTLKLVAGTCTVSWDQDMDLTDCKAIVLPTRFIIDNVAFSISDKLNFAFFYSKDTQKISRCEAQGNNFVNCLSTEAKIHLDEGMQLQSINPELPGSGSANVVFSSQSGTSVLFNFRFKFSKLAFDQVNSQRGSKFGSNEVTGLLLNKNTYSLYSNNKNGAVTPYLTFAASDLPTTGENFFNITNNDGHNAEVSKVVKFTVLDDINSISGIMGLPNFSGFKDNNVKQLGFNRGLVYGNNLKFEIQSKKKSQKNADFQIYNFNQVDYDLSALGKEFWFTCPHHGVTLKDNKLIRFDCKENHANGGAACALNEIVSSPLPKNEKVVYVTANEFKEEDGIIIVTSGEKTSTLIYFGLLEEGVFTKNFGDMSIKKGEVFFKVTGKHYTFWVIQNNKISLWAVYNKELNAMPPAAYSTVEAKTTGDNENFCPKYIQKSPLNAARVSVLSQCEGGENRLYSFYTTNVKDIKLMGRRSLTNSKISRGSYQTCDLGDEVLAFNSKSKQLFLTSRNTGISVSNVGWGSYLDGLDGVNCIRNSQAALIRGMKGGKKIFVVVVGNRNTDQSNRIHTVSEYEGEIIRVVNAGKGIMIIIKNGDKYSFNRVHFNGPLVFFNNNGFDEGTQELQLVMSSGDKELARKDFNITTSVFKSDITVNKDEKSENATSGAFDFFNLVSVKGPIFGANVKGNNGVSLTPRLIQDGSYVKQINGSLNVPEPDRIFSDGGYYSVGIRKTNMSTLAYYYHNRDQYWYVQDLFFFSTAYDLEFSGDDYVVYALATSEGGENHLRWSVKNFEKGRVTDGIAARDVKGDRISITAIGVDRYLVVVVDDSTNNAQVYQWSVKDDGNGFTFGESKTLDVIDNSKISFLFFIFLRKILFFFSFFNCF